MRLAVSDPSSILQRFTLIFDNAHEKGFCQIISVGENSLMARYALPQRADVDIGLTVIGASLAEAERWKGAA